MVFGSTESPADKDKESNPLSTSSSAVTPEQRALWILLAVVVCVSATVFLVANEGSSTDVPVANPSSTIVSPPPAPLSANGTLAVTPEVPFESTVAGIADSATAARALYAVVYTEEGFSPNPVTIEPDDSVLFVNASNSAFWPASNIHPTHEVLPEFDSLGPVAVGQTWMHTFDKPGQWRYHNHLNATHGGLVSAIPADPVVPTETPDVNASRDTVSPINISTPTFAPLADEDLPLHAGIQTDDTQLDAFLDMYGPLAALRVVQFADHGTDTCHDRAHDIGRLSYQKFGAPAFALAGHECRSGGFHGALEARFAERGTANLAADVAILCSWSSDPFTRHQCLHGVGHGVMAWTNYEIHQALDLCATVPGGRTDQGSCYGGVYMENVVGGLTAVMGHTTQWLRDDDPVYPCNVVKPEYQPDCYLFQTSRMSQLLNYDFAAVSKLCTQAPSPSQQSCWSSLGRDISHFSRLDPSASISACQHAPPGEPRTTCLAGAVQNGFWEQHGADRSVTFCGMLTDNAATECYRTIITRARSLFPNPAGFEQFCETLPETRQRSCTAG